MVTENGAVVEPAVTVTLVGIVSDGKPLLVNVATIPPTGAGLDKVNTQSLVAFAPIVAGLHCSAEIAVAAVRVRFTVLDVPLRVAVKLPVWSAERAPVLTVNGPVVDPAVTVSVAGRVNPDSPLAVRFTTAPLEGAAFDRATVQLLAVFGPKVVGLHWREVITAGAARLTLTLCELPL